MAGDRKQIDFVFLLCYTNAIYEWRKNMDYIWSDRKRTLFGLPLSFTKYRLTEDRLFIEKGFLNKSDTLLFCG